MLNSGSYGLDMLSSAIPISPSHGSTALQKQIAAKQVDYPPAKITAEAGASLQAAKIESGTNKAENTSQALARPEQADASSAGSSQVSSPGSTASSPKSQSTVSGAGTPQPGVTVCNNCMTTNTPLWRRDEHGQVLCNACGLFFKLHGRSRPISLKTDVIKSRCRNRSSSHVKPAGIQMLASAKKRSASGAVSNLPSEVQKLNMSNPTTHQIPKQAPAQMPPKVPGFYSPAVPLNTGFMQPPMPNPGLQQAHLQTLPHITEVPAVHNAPEALVSVPASQTNEFLAKRPLADVNTLRGYMSERLRPHEPPSCNGLESIPPLATPMDANSTDRRGANVLAVKSEEVIAGHQQFPHLAAVQPAQSVRDTKPTVEGLETRISELELVNDLLQQRIKDLEYSESQARRALVEAQTNAQALWQEVSILKGAKASIVSNM